MVESLGGPPTPAIGFGLGLERLAILLEASAAQYRRGPDLFLGVLGDAGGLEALAIGEKCRGLGMAVEVTLKGTGIAKQFKRADRLGARHAAVLGDGELASGRVKVKTMGTGSEEEVALEALPSWLAERR